MPKYEFMITYLVYGRSKYFIRYSELLLRIVFGKNTKIIILDNKGNFHNGLNLNELYEFTGYKKLIEIVLDAEPRKFGQCILINDTFFSHHFYPLWLLGLFFFKKRCMSDTIFGDIRYENGGEYIASWLFIIPFKSVGTFNESLNEALNLAVKNKKNYEANTLNSYACHLLPYERKRLIGWLFNGNSFYGWAHGAHFDDMPSSERYRKGVCIEIEHTLSKLLFQRTHVVDLKNIDYIFKIANLFDRFLSRIQRVSWIIHSFYKKL